MFSLDSCGSDILVLQMARYLLAHYYPMIISKHIWTSFQTLSRNLIRCAPPPAPTPNTPTPQPPPPSPTPPTASEAQFAASCAEELRLLLGASRQLQSPPKVQLPLAKALAGAWEVEGFVGWGGWVGGGGGGKLVLFRFWGRIVRHVLSVCSGQVFENGAQSFKLAYPSWFRREIPRNTSHAGPNL